MPAEDTAILLAKWAERSLTDGESAALLAALDRDPGLVAELADQAAVDLLLCVTVAGSGSRMRGKVLARLPARAPAAGARPRILRPAWRRLRWAAAAVVLFSVLSTLPWLGRGSGALQAMEGVARQLADLVDFTANFTTSYRYTPPLDSGIARADGSGTIRCALVPELRLRGDETWVFADAAQAPIADFANTRSWTRSGRGGWDEMRQAGCESFSQTDNDPANDQVFAFSEGEELLPPTPRRSAYELSRLLQEFRGNAYLAWFGKSWREDGGEALAGGGMRHRFRASSGPEAWTLGVELAADGRLRAITLEQTLADSNDTVLGSIASRYEIAAVNGGLGEETFAPPRRDDDPAPASDRDEP